MCPLSFVVVIGLKRYCLGVDEVEKLMLNTSRPSTCLIFEIIVVLVVSLFSIWFGCLLPSSLFALPVLSLYQYLFDCWAGLVSYVNPCLLVRVFEGALSRKTASSECTNGLLLVALRF